MCLSVLVIDLHEPDLRELLEIQSDQVSNVEVPAIGRADACEKDMRDTIADFQYAITSESVIESDPTKGESFCRARTFEIFVERGLRQGIGARPTVAGHDERRSVSLITHPAYEIYVYQFI